MANLNTSTFLNYSTSIPTFSEASASVRATPSTTITKSKKYETIQELLANIENFCGEAYQNGAMQVLVLENYSWTTISGYKMAYDAHKTADELTKECTWTYDGDGDNVKKIFITAGNVSAQIAKYKEELFPVQETVKLHIQEKTGLDKRYASLEETFKDVISTCEEAYEKGAMHVLLLREFGWLGRTVKFRMVYEAGLSLDELKNKFVRSYEGEGEELKTIFSTNGNVQAQLDSYKESLKPAQEIKKPESQTPPPPRYESKGFTTEAEALSHLPKILAQAKSVGAHHVLLTRYDDYGRYMKYYLKYDAEEENLELNALKKKHYSYYEGECVQVQKVFSTKTAAEMVE